MIPQQVYELCRSDKSISSELAKDPHKSPHKAIHRFYRERKEQTIIAKTVKEVVDAKDDLQRACICGNWGSSRPSNLFLQVDLLPKRSAFNVF